MRLAYLHHAFARIQADNSTPFDDENAMTEYYRMLLAYTAVEPGINLQAAEYDAIRINFDVNDLQLVTRTWPLKRRFLEARQLNRGPVSTPMLLMDGVQPTILGMCFMMNVPLKAATSIHRRLIGLAENQAEQDDAFQRTYLAAIFMYTLFEVRSALMPEWYPANLLGGQRRVALLKDVDEWLLNVTGNLTRPLSGAALNLVRFAASVSGAIEAMEIQLDEASQEDRNNYEDLGRRFDAYDVMLGDQNMAGVESQ